MAKKSGGVMKVQNSRKVYFPIYLMIIILLGTVLLMKTSGKGIDNALLRIVIAFSAAGIIFTELHRGIYSYEINNHSLVCRRGFFIRRTKTIDLLAISDADSKQNPWQRLLDYGNVNVRLFSKDSTTLIKNINNPEQFVHFLEIKMAERRGEK